MIDLNAEVTAGMAAVRNRATLENSPKRDLSAEDQSLSFFIEVIKMNPNRAKLDGS